MSMSDSLRGGCIHLAAGYSWWARAAWLVGWKRTMISLYIKFTRDHSQPTQIVNSHINNINKNFHLKKTTLFKYIAFDLYKVCQFTTSNMCMYECVWSSINDECYNCAFCGAPRLVHISHTKSYNTLFSWQFFLFLQLVRHSLIRWYIRFIRIWRLGGWNTSSESTLWPSHSPAITPQ